MHPMTTTTYNGYTNRATWNCALWLTNDESIYRLMVETFRQEQADTESVQFFCNLLWPNCETPDGDELADVNWPEVVSVVQECCC